MANENPGLEISEDGEIVSENITSAKTEDVESILSGKKTVDVNRYVDKALNLVNEKIVKHSLQQIDLPQHELGFEKDFACGIILPGNIDFQEGHLKGLSSFCRTGDANIDFDAFSDKIITAKASIGIRQTDIDYAALIDFYCFGQNVKVIGTLSDFSLNIVLHVDRHLSVQMDQFDLSAHGKIVLDFEDIGSFEFLSDSMKDSISDKVKTSLLEYLQTKVKTFTSEVLSVLPIEI